ncbi:Phosphatidylinositol 4-kinase type 2-beta [Phytophthora pseudosyringae]|uniref:Phosphatidylinositol 4-kinase type 2-beta n=1 Tax=Phytophthora pseudosyringae TaxID=221518 RepID=A0A8T1W204_9STRA|nr:Phosphatidylinositol 4-kinase type 2-beta [Phytophthora pseudosyringae]
MVAAAHSRVQLAAPEQLKQPVSSPSITSRTSTRRLTASAEVVASIMQSLSISAAHRSPAINACQPTRVLTSSGKPAQPPAAAAFNQSKPPQPTVDDVHKGPANAVSALDLQSIAKELPDHSDSARSKQPAVSIEVLKPATCTGSSAYAKEMALLASQVHTGLQARVAPIPVDDCTGGVYYLRTKNRRLTGVFKPADEEAYAPNNPKLYHKPEQASGVSGMREGISAGDAAVREVAAYLLDHQHFARVPVTMLASIYHPDFHFRASQTPHRKTGSLQAYVAHQDTADDVGAAMFNVAEVQAIAILDIRLANQDRHGGNMLVLEPAQLVAQTSTAVVTKSMTGKKVSLVPIDHGACLPRLSSLSETSFMWLLWPQSKEPFSSVALEYIAALDAHNDLKLLDDNLPANFQLEREAMLTLHVCTALLKFCALDRHMTAYDVGIIMCRQGTAAQQEMRPSVLETLITSSLRDPAVVKSEAFLKLQDKQQAVQKTAASSLDKKAPSQDKAWTNYIATFMATFRRELVAHLAATE